MQTTCANSTNADGLACDDCDRMDILCVATTDDGGDDEQMMVIAAGIPAQNIQDFSRAWAEWGWPAPVIRSSKLCLHVRIGTLLR